MRGSGAYSNHISSRSSSVTISSVSSSWLRRKMHHCVSAGISGVGSQDLDDGRRLFPLEAEKQPRHDGEMESHLELGLVLGAEVVDDVPRPLICLGQQQLAWIFALDHGPKGAEKLMRLGKVLAIGVFALVEIRDGIASKSVDAEVEPEPGDAEHLVPDRRIVKVDIRLMLEEAVPVVLLCNLIERPVRRLGIDEDDPGVAVSGRIVGPDEVIPLRPSRDHVALPETTRAHRSSGS